LIIYKCKNKINKKCYIGQTVHTLNKRIKSHIIRTNNNSKTYFHNALRKYGFENFEWEVIEKCESKEELDEMEFHYIKQYKSYWKENGYNLTYGGDGRYGFIVNDETKKKLSIANKGKKRSEKTKEKIRVAQTGKKNSFYGKKHTKKSLETIKRKVSESLSGRSIDYEWRKKISESLKGRSLSEDTKKKISKSLKGRIFSKETIEKFRISNTGEKNPMYGHKYTEKELNKISKNDYIAINNKGEKEHFKVLSLWCKNKNLSVHVMRRTMKTGKFAKNGWRIKKLNER
jgi:group I intron endonuclease